jgi:hypothetical protein
MAGRAIYVKHVLRAVPVYNLMLFNHSKDGFRQLERLSSQFVWGKSEEGRFKTPLVAWNKITQSKCQGGLGLHPLMEQAQLLKFWNVSKLMEGQDRDWIAMARDLIRRSLNTGPNRLETKEWLLQEFLLFDPEVSIQSKTLRYVLAGWQLARKQLQLEVGDSRISKSLSIEQAFRLCRFNNVVSDKDWRALKIWCGTRSLHSVADCIDIGGKWLDITVASLRARPSREVGFEQAQEHFEFFVKSKGTTEEPLEKESAGNGSPMEGKSQVGHSQYKYGEH